MFTHIDTINGNTFTTGETITGSTSGATGTLESESQTTKVVSSISTAGPPWCCNICFRPTFKEGQQIKFNRLLMMHKIILQQ